MHLKGIIFDLDGTLANTLPLCIQTYQRALKHFTGRSFSKEEIIAHFGITEEGIMQRFVPDQWEAALQFYHRAYEETHHICPEPFPKILTALELLKERGVRLALVTGKGPHTAAFSLDYLDLARFFDMVETGEREGISKEKAIRKVLAHWQLPAEQAAYVGDADTDMQEARAAGVLALAACWADTTTIRADDPQRPDATFTSIDDFIGWLDKHIAQSPAL